MQDQETLEKEINALFAENRGVEIRHLLRDVPAPDIAALLTRLDSGGRILVFRLLQRSTADQVFSYLESSEKDELLRDLTDEETRRLLAGRWSLYRKRIGWLTGLILVNLAASEIIASRGELLISSIALAFIIPLLIATGGNTGAQSATVMICAIATGGSRGRSQPSMGLHRWLAASEEEAPFT